MFKPWSTGASLMLSLLLAMPAIAAPTNAKKQAVISGAYTRFKAMAIQGDPQVGLKLLDKLDAFAD